MRPDTLTKLAEAEQACRRCPLYKHATQAVPGEGPTTAKLMLVGEQPGNDEDLSGKPFIGPAGKMLDRALEEAGLDRRKLFVTNAVKHFKFEPRGKRRLHQRPNPDEIDACKLWEEIELSLVKPKLIVALGATALRSLLGRPATITSLRGKPIPLGETRQLLATIHPSFLLRLREEADRKSQYRRFVADLKQAGKLVA